MEYTIFYSIINILSNFHWLPLLKQVDCPSICIDIAHKSAAGWVHPKCQKLYPIVYHRWKLAGRLAISPFRPKRFQLGWGLLFLGSMVAIQILCFLLQINPGPGSFCGLETDLGQKGLGFLLLLQIVIWWRNSGSFDRKSSLIQGWTFNRFSSWGKCGQDRT